MIWRQYQNPHAPLICKAKLQKKACYTWHTYWTCAECLIHTELSLDDSAVAFTEASMLSWVLNVGMTSAQSRSSSRILQRAMRTVMSTSNEACSSIAVNKQKNWLWPKSVIYSEDHGLDSIEGNTRTCVSTSMRASHPLHSCKGLGIMSKRTASESSNNTMKLPARNSKFSILMGIVHTPKVLSRHGNVFHEVRGKLNDNILPLVSRLISHIHCISHNVIRVICNLSCHLNHFRLRLEKEHTQKKLHWMSRHDTAVASL